jgi:hypothetical protein
MNLVRIIILIIGLIPNCYKTDSNKTRKPENESANNEKSIFKDKKYLITEKGVLGLFIGDSIPKKLDNYKLIKSFKIVEEGNEEPIIKVIENNVELLQICLEYDNENKRFINKIGEILIKDKKFRTEENIGVESTISDFVNSYSNYYMWYTYISGLYVIQSKDKKIQFVLDERGYIGKRNLMEGDSVELKKEDFSSNTKIVAIRIY